MSRAHMNRFLLLSAVATAATFGVTAPAHAADIPWSRLPHGRRHE